MDKTRERIYGRQRVEVDNRTPGIKAASHPTSAMGSTYSTSVVHATKGDSFNIWATFAPAFGDIVRAASSVLDKQERERLRAEAKAEREAEKAELRAEREAAKAEAKAEKQLEALESWKAFEFAQDLRKDLATASRDGTITTEDQFLDYIRSKTDGIKEAASTTFLGKAAPLVHSVAQEGLEKLNLRNQRNFEAYLQGQLTDGLSKALGNYDPEDAESSQALAQAFESARSLAKSVGKDDIEVNAVALSSAHQAIRRAAYEAPERMLGLVNWAKRLPGGEQSTDDLVVEMNRVVLTEADRKERKLLEEENKAFTRNRLQTQARLSGMPVEDLHANLAKIQNNLEDARGLYGDHTSSMINDYLQEIDRRLQQDDRAERERIKESEGKANTAVVRIKRGEYLSDEELLGMRLHPQHVASLLEVRASTEARLAAQRQGIVEKVKEEFGRRFPAEASFAFERDKEGRPILSEKQLRFYNGRISAAVSGVRRSDFPDGEDGYAEFVSAQEDAGNKAIESIFRMENGFRWENPQGYKGEQATFAKPELLTASDIKSNPDAMDAFKKKLLGGTVPIKADRTGSGRPLYAKVDWKFYKEIDEPQKIRIANQLIRVAALEEAYKEMQDTWPTLKNHMGQVLQKTSRYAENEKEWRSVYEGKWWWFDTPEQTRATAFFNQYDMGKMNIYSHPEYVPFKLEELELRKVPDDTAIPEEK